ncbi:DotU family type IV/VI secretion system protein [Roseomonas genomospecies 6]|uniref:DotU family type IV/VI secretion system protein n=1 Tax=Roseomonas genomospecies 6 TaxID=214106 RepID=UPI00142EBA68|nr:DotU family type IV/VI secretion system protein [Roseomonas genomospecies 6]
MTVQLAQAQLAQAQPNQAPKLPPAAPRPAGTLALFRAFQEDLLAGCADAQAPAGAVADRLVATLHGMSGAAVAQGPAAHGTVVKAVFAMAMLADRALTQTRPADAVVSTRLFGANASLQTLFVQADDLIRQGAKADRALAAVYLAALALGFPEDAQATARRPALHRIVVGERAAPDRPSPQACDPPPGAVPGYAAPSGRRWWWAVGGTAVLFLVVSHLLWTGAVGDIQRDLSGARAAVEDMGLSWSY